MPRQASTELDICQWGPEKNTKMLLEIEMIYGVTFGVWGYAKR